MRRSLTEWQGWSFDHRPWFTVRDVERMTRDPQVSFGLEAIKGPIHVAEWEVQGRNDRVNSFVQQTVRRFWDKDLDKALAAVEWGDAGGEVYYAEDNGYMQYDTFHDLPWVSMTPLSQSGKMVGLKVKGGDGSFTFGNSEVVLSCPNYFWLPNRPRFGSFRGRSRLGPAWEPFMEKRARHGAVDSRRLWYQKNAYDGGVMYHPYGTLQFPDGTEVDAGDWAQQMLERKETGGSLAVPSLFDPETKQRMWEYKPPQANSTMEDLRQYPKDLDREILLGLGVPPEMIEGGELAGTGYAGRAIPALIFYTMEDQLVDLIISWFDDLVVWPLVLYNFGNIEYHILPTSLLKTQREDHQQQKNMPQGPAPTGSTVSYHGPRGGEGRRNPVTGNIDYHLSPGTGHMKQQYTQAAFSGSRVAELSEEQLELFFAA